MYVIENISLAKQIISLTGNISWDSYWACSVELLRTKAEEALLQTWVSFLKI